jgi:hypothetical protein
MVATSRPLTSPRPSGTASTRFQASTTVARKTIQEMAKATRDAVRTGAE